MPRLARGAMDQHLLDIGAVRLVGRRIEPELDRADDPAVKLRGQQNGVSRFDGTCDLAEERQCLALRERRHEVDTGAAFDAVDQHIRELLQRGIRDRRRKRDDFGLRSHAARSSLEATVASALR